VIIALFIFLSIFFIPLFTLCMAIIVRPKFLEKLVIKIPDTTSTKVITLMILGLYMFFWGMVTFYMSVLNSQIL